MIVASAFVVLITFLIGLMSVAGIHSNIMRARIFYIFPPSRFLANALYGIEKLKALDEVVTDEKGAVFKEQKQGIVKSGDKGFKEIINIIKNAHSLEGEFQEIMLVEDDAGVLIGNSPSRIRLLVLKKEANDISLPTDPFDPDKPMRELANIVDEMFRRRLAYWSMGLLGMWLIANSFLLYLLNG